MGNSAQREKFLIVDGDDTLWDVESLYEAARLSIRSLIASTSVDPDAWERLQRQTDLERFEVERFSPSRFPGSCVSAYLALAERPQGSEAQSTKERIDEIARQVFSMRAPVAPDAAGTLAALRSTFRLLLLTQGDITIQKKRIADSDLGPLFDHLLITEHKDKAAFQKAISQVGGESFNGWSIGNSLASDIEPALQCGLRAILVQSKSWEFERRSSSVQIEDIDCVTTLSDVVPILLGARQLESPNQLTSRIRQHWTRRKPAHDPSRVGITFVDVLFALVMERVLDPFASSIKPTSAGTAQLVLAGVLTVTSWIGYHSSWNRPQWFIRFPSLPLCQFLTDVFLVVDYWFLATTYPSSDTSASPLAAVICVAIAFGFYAIWDITSYWMRKDDRYEGWPLDKDVPQRRRVTYTFLGVSAVPLIWVSAALPRGARTSIVISAILAFICIAYRFVKDYFYLDDEPEPSEEGCSASEQQA